MRDIKPFNRIALSLSQTLSSEYIVQFPINIKGTVSYDIPSFGLECRILFDESREMIEIVNVMRSQLRI